MSWHLKRKPPSPGVTTSVPSPDEGTLRAAEALRSTTLNAYDGELVSAELGAIRREILAARISDRKPE